MTCPSCGVETKGISLNGKMYCSQCGNDLGIKAEAPKNEPKKPAPEVFEVPEPKIIEKETEEPKTIPVTPVVIEEKIIPETEKETKQVTETEKLRKTEETLDALMNEYFRPKKVEIAPAKSAKTAQPAKETIDDELKDIEKEILETSRIVKANRPRINKPIGITKNIPGVSVETPKEKEKPSEPLITQVEEDKNPPEAPVIPPAEIQQIVQEEITLPEEINLPETKPEVIAPVSEPENIQVSTPVIEESQNTEPVTEEQKEPEETTLPPKTGISVNLMQAEKGYCVKCKQTREIVDPKDVTLKNGHPALKGTCATCGTAMFKIKKGLNEDVAAKNKKKKNSSHLLTSFFQQKAKEAQPHHQKLPETKPKEPAAKPPKKQKERKPFFFFGKKKNKKEPAIKPEQTKPVMKVEKEQVAEKPKIKKKHPILKRIIIALLIITIPIAGFIGFVYYVTNFAANAESTKTKAEQSVSFNYKKPNYLPAGYVLSFKTNAKSDFIEYIYEYEPDKNRLLKIKITKQDISEEDFLNKVVKPNGEKYTTSNVKESEVWFVEDKGAFFSKDGVIYEITNSDKISKDELTKIVDSLI